MAGYSAITPHFLSKICSPFPKIYAITGCYCNPSTNDNTGEIFFSKSREMAVFSVSYWCCKCTSVLIYLFLHFPVVLYLISSTYHLSNLPRKKTCVNPPKPSSQGYLCFDDGVYGQDYIWFVEGDFNEFFSIWLCPANLDSYWLPTDLQCTIEKKYRTVKYPCHGTMILFMLLLRSLER